MGPRYGTVAWKLSAWWTGVPAPDRMKNPTAPEAKVASAIEV
jgi:hypothetical protein